MNKHGALWYFIVILLSLLALCVAFYAGYMYGLSVAPKFPPTIAPPSASETNPSSAANTLSVRIGEEKALSLAQTYLPTNTPVTPESITFSATDGVSVSGRINFKSAAELAGLADNSVTGFLSGLLPTDATFTASVIISAANGNLTVLPSSLSVSGISVPVEYLPTSLFSALADALKEQALSAGFALDYVSVSDGYIEICDAPA